MSLYEAFSLPPGMKLGCSTSATQIEGGDQNNSWVDWCGKDKKIVDKSSCFRANDHWVRYEEDISLMAEMGVEIYRMGVEWSRIEPENGVFDEAAIMRYRRELQLLNENGISPLVTLHHFTNPRWFEKMGAFTNPDCLTYFIRYVTFVIERLGDLCTDFITINEPNVYAFHSYLLGLWPPGGKSVFKTFRVMRNMAMCHIAAYQLIHKIRAEKSFPGETKVGIANHLRVFVPYNSKNPFDILGAKLFRSLFQDKLTETMAHGKLSFPFGFGAPQGEGRFYDFIGINYYSRSAIRWFHNEFLPDVPVNDLGWEIYPEGIAILASEQYEKYCAPIWITENGTCDKNDSFRTEYIYSHLKALARSGLPVERYYHWTFLDNFEWSEGEAAPFGVVRCDFETQQREIKKSGRFYSRVMKEKQVSLDLIDDFLCEIQKGMKNRQ